MATTTGVKLYLTAEQCKYLGMPGKKGAEGYEIGDEPEDTCITMVSDDGWIFVELARNVGEDGSGVWVDANGSEHHGPGEDRSNSAAAEEFYKDLDGNGGPAHESIDIEDEIEVTATIHIEDIGKGDAHKAIMDALEEDPRIKHVHLSS